jgi:hypothetical protein
MKTIVICKEGREIGRYQLSKQNLLIGRSPVCDVVLRATYVQPIHYWLEYVSGAEGTENTGATLNIDELDESAGAGIWSLTNIAHTTNLTNKSELLGSFSGEGVVLGADRIEYSGLEFEIIEDRLQESDIKKGVLKREIERGAKQVHDRTYQAQSQDQVLSVIYHRKDIDVVSNIVYLNKASALRKYRILPTLKGSYFSWHSTKANASPSGSLVFSNQTDFKNIEIYDRDRKIEMELKEGVYSLDVTTGSFLKIKTPQLDYILRFVPKFSVVLAKASPFKDPALRVTLFVVFFVMFVSWLTQFAKVETDNEEVKKRIATVIIKEEPVPQPAVKVEPPPLPPPPAPLAEKKTEVHKELAKSQMSAAQIVNSTQKKPKAGLNSPAPTTNVNTVGLLGKLKGMKASGTVAADAILNQGVITETASGNTGFVVNRSAGGVVGSGKVKDNALAEASTTLSNSAAADPSATGSLSMTGGKGKFSYGLGKEGILGSGPGDGLGHSESLEVSGGLDKDAVRAALAEHRRALRNCYESALLTKSKLEGKLIIRWHISPQGSVTTTRLVSSTLKTPQFEACIENVIKGILFPQAASGQPTTVIYPFVFQGKK